MSRRPSPAVAIFLTVFFDMLSFGLCIPDLQKRGQALGAVGIVLGAVLASFSLAQFIVAPYFGRLSDRVGRRPVLMITCALNVVSFLLYANAYHLPILTLSRVLAGIGGANLPVAFAYVADITAPENRAKGLGSLGAAFGLGFIIGPALGAALVRWGGGHPTLLGLTAASLAMVNLLFIVFFLPEPDARRTDDATASINPFVPIRTAFTSPEIRTPILLFFVANFAFSNLESTFFLLSDRQFHMTSGEAALVLTWVGVVAAIMQGKVVGMVQPKIGEVRMMQIGYFLTAPILMLMPFTHPWIPLLIGAMVLGIGNGMSGPAIQSLISRAARADMQGGIFGITQSFGSLARILGPLVGATLFDHVSPAAPYLFAGTLTLVRSWAPFVCQILTTTANPPRRPHKARGRVRTCAFMLRSFSVLPASKRLALRFACLSSLRESR